MQVTLFDKTDHGIISTIEWKDLMKRIRDGYWKDIVEQSRRESFGRDELKKRLPAFGTSVTFVGGDEAANVVKYNHIVSIDFNKVITDTNDGSEKIAQCREMCCKIPSVVGFYITKSGRGFRIFVLVNSTIDEHKIIYHPLQEHFEHLLGLQADDKYMDLTRLSFVSYDPDCFYRNIEDADKFKIETLVPFKNTMRQEPASIGTIIKTVTDYLGKTYDFRYDTLSQKIQYRIRPDIGHVVPAATRWTELSDKLNDEIVSDINSNCIDLTYNQFKWMLDNHYIVQQHDPIKLFDEQLPDWNGKDHIAQLASILIGSPNQHFKQDLTIWLVNMYRMWMGYKMETPNILVLQSDCSGSGKTSWALKVLPPSLRKYMYVGIASYTLFHTNDITRNKLLFVAEDYIGNYNDLNWVSNKTSFIITTAKVLPCDAIKPKGCFCYQHIQRNDGNVTAPVIDHPELYAQVKFLAKV